MDCCNVASCIKVNSSINEVIAKKEYVNINADITDTDNYTAVFRTAQAGTYKIYIYNALGIPKKNINYKTEFINRTKQTYLNIKGEYKDIGFENKINVHLFINTDIYNKYEVQFQDGLIFVVLHEIINKKPILTDVSK